jgi:2-amino-4-hydroxy-6-hydroxymethyldihydropteridine diphosphokinase
MILIALGANLPSRYGTPLETLQAAKHELRAHGLKIVKESRTWLTRPEPYDPNQDWFHNAVISVETDLPARSLLDLMHNIEKNFGRTRFKKNESRVLDLDLLAYNDDIIEADDTIIVPHPRMHERLFVLKPLEDISKNWNHPVKRQSVAEMLRDLPPGQQAKPVEEGDRTA